MKTPLVIALAVALLCGCTTTPQPQTVQRIASAAQLASFTGAAFYLLDHPEDRQTFQIVLASVDALLASGSTDPDAFRLALSKLPMRELRSTRSGIIVAAAIMVWTEYESQITPATRDSITPIMRGVSDGLQAALAATEAHQ